MVEFNSQTVDPYTPEEIQEVLDKTAPGEVFKVDPNRVRTMHAGIANSFSNGERIEDTVGQLKTDPASVKHLPPIKLAAVEMPRGNGQSDLQLYTEDHRRVVAAREANVQELNAQMRADPNVSGNFTTENEGMSLEVREYHNPEHGKHQHGGNKSTFPPQGQVYKYASLEFRVGG